MTEQKSMESTPAINWSQMHESEHFVQFYEDPAYLFDSVSGYLGDGLRSDVACMILARETHLNEIESRLQARGIDLSAARKAGQYLSFEANEILRKLSVDGRVDRQIFFDTVGQAVQAAKSRFPKVRVFGEMVTLLCEQGRYDQAHVLEGFWNELGNQHAFALFCAYPLSCFSSGEHAEAFAQVCANHARVIPSERYSSLGDAAGRLQVIGQLQQKAHALEHEVKLRRQAERQLEAREQALRDFLENAVEVSREAQTELQQLNEVLETRVRERTEELKRSELQFSRLVAGVADYAIYLLDVHGHVATWNTGATRIKGYSAEEIIGKHFSLFYTEEDRKAGGPQRALETAARQGKYEAEAWRVRKDGSKFWASVLLDAIHGSNGELLGFAKVTRDMTERRAMEEALRQSQKMEAIGQLTGGVAHDFNNLLTVIIGNLEALTRQLPAAAPKVNRAIDLATRSAQRAVTLTQQLLAFSRKQPLNPKPTDINRLVASMSDLLRRSLGENIRIETVLAGGLWKTEVDPHQLESALLNLAVNARDAMQEKGGTLSIESANVGLEGAARSHGEMIPGDYVCLSISDTGVGMSDEVITRAFEPFFTTKPLGQGTGLGLSQVYGFIKQSGGHIKLYSETGHGTTVRIYLPRLIAVENEDIETPRPVFVPQGNHHETVLVVEDDRDVRFHSTDSLRELGFTVLEAPDGPSALRVIDEHPEIQLLFTDVGLPGMNGRELMEQARARRPNLRVLFTSGYAQSAIMNQGRLEPGVELLPKPFTHMQLAHRVREILDSPPPHAAKQSRVLVVDDEALVRDFLTDTLREMGFQVVEAGTVAAALRAARSEESLDVALVDLGLPDRSGLELIDELRTLRPQLPVLIASGYGDMVRRDARDAGRKPQFLSKPYDAAAIARALNELGIRVPKRLLN